MPIQFPITQPSGVTASYHVLQNSTYNNSLPPNGTVVVNSYFDKDHCPAFPIGSENLDISPVLSSPFTNPSEVMTVAQTINDAVEKYLLMTPTFSGGTQVV